MNVLVAPVSINICILWLLTRVFIKVKERSDGFFVVFPESTPSCDDSGTKSMDRQRPLVARL